jgi:hypothetical protein
LAGACIEMAVPLKPVLLFAHTSMDALANAVVSGCEKTNLLSHPSDTNLLQHVSLFHLSLLYYSNVVMTFIIE